LIEEPVVDVHSGYFHWREGITIEAAVALDSSKMIAIEIVTTAPVTNSD
jgi:hypothetical protein